MFFLQINPSQLRQSQQIFKICLFMIALLLWSVPQQSFAQKLWGLTLQGGSSDNGVLYKYNIGTHSYSKKIDLSYFNGSYPEGSLMKASNGKMYGMTQSGGMNGYGVIFEYDPSTNIYTKKIELDPSWGLAPYGSLMQASNGKLYGLTFRGGANDLGVLFEYNPASNTYIKKVDLSSTTGYYPWGSLIQASNGLLYGMALFGGANSGGSLFEFDPNSGTFNKRVDLSDGIGKFPYGSLMQASNGKLFGMTGYGGSNNAGVIFEFTPSTGIYSKKIDLVTSTGAKPYGDLMQASNGKMYGMTAEGGANGVGVIFEYDPSTNAYTKMMDFSDSLGRLPFGSFMQASNGKLYGVTSGGGANSKGVLFEYEFLTNVYSKLYDWDSTNGRGPFYSTLIEMNIAESEITVKGNNVIITDGDNTPSTDDHTDFGDVSVGSSLIRTYTIENTGDASLNIDSIRLSGTGAGNYLIGGITLPGTVASGGSVTFTVTFSPSSSGVKTATVKVYNNTLDKATFDFAIQGAGTQLTLVINATNGSVTKNPDLPNYVNGTQVIVTAIPIEGYHFTGWGGDLSGTENPDTITMNGNKTITANFAINTYILSVSGDYGVVTKNPNQESYEHGTVVQVSQTPDERYLFTEWSGDASGTDNPLSVTMDGNKSVQANYIIDPVYQVMHRTAKMEDWATAKDGKGKYLSVKRKNDKVFFKFNIIADSSRPLSMDFGMLVNATLTRGKAKSETLAVITNSKKITDTLFTVTAGETLQVDGIGMKGKKIAVKYQWGKKKAITLKADSLFKLNRVGLPVPNLHNVGEELFPVKKIQTGYYSKLNPLVVGVPQGLKKANSVTHLKYADVQKSLVKIVKKMPRLHSDTLAARCLDSLDGKKKKAMLTQQKSLPPDKQNNKLFAEVLTLKLNVAASATEKFPAGFGQLTFDDPSDVGNHFNGMSVDSIVIEADSILSCVQSEIDVTPGELYGTIRMINMAFADTTIDTLSFGSKTKLTGVKSLFEVDYLHPTEGVKPRIVQSFDVASEQPEEFALYQNYPNPFNPSTVISYSLSVNSVVTLKVYNMLGQEVATLLNKQEMEAGDYELPFSAKGGSASGGNAFDLPSGVYFYRINIESVDEDGMRQTFSDVKRMLMLK